MADEDGGLAGDIHALTIDQSATVLQSPPRANFPLPRELRDQIYGYLHHHEYVHDKPWYARCFGSFQFSWGDFCWDLLRLATSEKSRSQRGTWEEYPAQLGSSKEFPVRRSMFDGFERISTIRAYCQPGSRFDKLPLRSLLQRTRYFECSNYRDKVYSLLSLISPREAALLPPLYNIPWIEVFAKAIYASIVSEGGYEVWLLSEFSRTTLASDQVGPSISPDIDKTL